MQYKIPVQIENEDPILLGLSLRQLAIIMIWWAIAYNVFLSLSASVWKEVAMLPSWIIALVTFLIATFKQYEMTFIPFILAFIRFNVNINERRRQQWTDCINPLDIWYVTKSNDKKEEKIDFTSKIDKINNLEDKLKKI